MLILKPFASTIEYKKEALSAISVSAECSLLDEDQLSFEYQIQDDQYMVLFPPISKKARKHDLWKQTCFEAFLAVENSTQYYEFNFSSSCEWNVYKFETYRSPQPPKETFDFDVNEILWQDRTLKVQCQNKTGFKKFDVSLNAVVELKTGEKIYFALTHSKEKADFHLRQNFSIQRGLK